MMDFVHGGKPKTILEASHDWMSRLQRVAQHSFIISHHQVEDQVHLGEVGVLRNIKVACICM